MGQRNRPKREPRKEPAKMPSERQESGKTRQEPRRPTNLAMQQAMNWARTRRD